MEYSIDDYKNRVRVVSGNYGVSCKDCGKYLGDECIAMSKREQIYHYLKKHFDICTTTDTTQ